MKKVRRVMILTGLLGLLFNSVQVYATPTIGYTWSSRNITYQNNGSNTFYQDIWTDARDNWNLSTDVFMQAGTNSNFTAGNKSDSSVDWDGRADYTYNILTKHFTSMKTWVNTYYTTQSHYTTSHIQGVTTHEFGHALGLDHSFRGDSTVMTPETFYTTSGVRHDGRPFKSPTSWDVLTINVIYDKSSLSGEPQNELVKQIPEHIMQKAQATQKEVQVQNYSWAMGYGTLADRKDAADLVVSGKINKKLDSVLDIDGNFNQSYIQSEIVIGDVVKGDVSTGDTISLLQIGGETDTAIIYHEHSTELPVGEEVLLYLRKVGDNKYIPINEDQSIFVKQSDSLFKNLYDSSTVTFEDLVTSSYK